MALPPITLFHEFNALVTPYPVEQSSLAQAVSGGSVTEHTHGKHINFGSRLTILLFFFYFDKSDIRYSKFKVYNMLLSYIYKL